MSFYQAIVTLPSRDLYRSALDTFRYYMRRSLSTTNPAGLSVRPMKRKIRAEKKGYPESSGAHRVRNGIGVASGHEAGEKVDALIGERRVQGNFGVTTR